MWVYDDVIFIYLSCTCGYMMMIASEIGVLCTYREWGQIVSTLIYTPEPITLSYYYIGLIRILSVI